MESFPYKTFLVKKGRKPRTRLPPCKEANATPALNPKNQCFFPQSQLLSTTVLMTVAGAFCGDGIGTGCRYVDGIAIDCAAAGISSNGANGASGINPNSDGCAGPVDFAGTNDTGRS